MFDNFDWSPGLGDATLRGWLVVIAYISAAVAWGLCVLYARQIFPHRELGRQRLVWGGLAGVLLFLGINKQLDLQTLFTSVGRELSLQQGWYAARQTVEDIFVVIIATGGLLLLSWWAWNLRLTLRQHGLLVLGLLLLFSFVVFRAAYLYGVPVFRYPGGLRGFWLLEPLGAFITGSAALERLFRRGPARQKA